MSVKSFWICNITILSAQVQTRTLESRCEELLALSQIQKTEKEQLEVKIVESTEIEKVNLELIDKLKEDLSEAQLTLKSKEEEFQIQNTSNESLLTELRAQIDRLKEEITCLHVSSRIFDDEQN